MTKELFIRSIEAAVKDKNRKSGKIFITSSDRQFLGCPCKDIPFDATLNGGPDHVVPIVHNNVWDGLLKCSKDHLFKLTK